ncbi:hypothetical protein D0817_15075 [Flavobacterium cupreum]|uniref:Signal peptidase n=1 Tax=Flavobacterium cupreum TaxID=2133766 RepID=A0A434A587_9FLAO|nr:hypothetical protein [Flavobacterium cupreum]RUT69502.1 hypothetical protein D0817_15075 [Flavobacterium cupreum]
MKKIIHVILLFFVCAVAFSQSGPPPPDFEDPNDPNPTDKPSVPIDTHIVLLCGAALFFGLYVIYKKKHKSLN